MQIEHQKLSVPQMILIGAFDRNSGKTTLACRLIEQWKQVANVYAVKVITIHSPNSGCHRGKKGCGLCTSLCGDYQLIEETGGNPEKDTAQMLTAGARKSFLLKSLRGNLSRAFSYFLEQIPKGALIVAESNTLRNYVEPGAFVFSSFEQPLESSIKKSALEVYSHADMILNPEDEQAIKAICLHWNSDGTISVQPDLRGPWQSTYMNAAE